MRVKKEGVKKKNGIISIFSFSAMTDISSILNTMDAADIFSNTGDDPLSALSDPANVDKIKQITRWEQVEKKQAVKLTSFNPWEVIRLGGGTATADR